MRRKKSLAWIAALWLAVAASLGPGIAWADGYIVPGPEVSSSSMADQKAAIVYHDGREDLIISIGLSTEGQAGSADVAWVIPVPAPPAVATAPASLFDELDRIAAPEVIYRQERRGGLRLFPGMESGAPPQVVEVLERKQVGIYDVAVLAGREAGGVLDWLQTEGFQVPAAIEAPLDAYIAEGWTFVAMRIAPETGQVLSAEPVWLSFEADDMVYPMRLTAAQGQSLALRLYILADHRYELPGFAVEFAGTATVPATDPALAAVLDREYFVTKLFDQEVTPADMAADFYPEQAASDDFYRQQQYYTHVSAGGGTGLGELACLCGGCWLGLFLLLVAIVAAVLVLRRRKRGGP